LAATGDSTCATASLETHAADAWLHYWYTVKNAVELLGAFRPDVEKIQYH
jgi:hypothetical protein